MLEQQVPMVVRRRRTQQSGQPTAQLPLTTGQRVQRHVVGLVVLLVVVIPGYLTSRITVSAPPAAVEIAGAVAEAASTDDSSVPDVSPLEIEAHIREVAVNYGVSPALVAAIIEAESEFNPRAVSRKGARGLMQLMPQTASSLQVEDSFDPFENIEGGVKHLRRLMDRFHGNLPLVLAAYNAGEQAVVNYGGVPPYRETRRYVRRILRRIGYEGVAIPASADATTRLRVRTASLESSRATPDVVRAAAVSPRAMGATTRTAEKLGPSRRDPEKLGPSRPSDRTIESTAARRSNSPGTGATDRSGGGAVTAP